LNTERYITTFQLFLTLVDLRNQKVVSNEQGWILKLTEEIKIQTLANIEDSMFGHDLLDVRINGLPLPIHGDALSIF